MCYELQESTQRGQEDTGVGSETQGWCMCENSSLVWEADIATEAIRYLDVMLNMLPVSLPLPPSRSVSVSSPLRRLIAHGSDTREEKKCRG